MSCDLLPSVLRVAFAEGKGENLPTTGGSIGGIELPLGREKWYPKSGFVDEWQDATSTDDLPPGLLIENDSHVVGTRGSAQ